MLKQKLEIEKRQKLEILIGSQEERERVKRELLLSNLERNLRIEAIERQRRLRQVSIIFSFSFFTMMQSLCNFI